MKQTLEEFLSDPFHSCALAAYYDIAAETGKPPESEATRRRAYQYYEQEKRNDTRPD